MIYFVCDIHKLTLLCYDCGVFNFTLEISNHHVLLLVTIYCMYILNNMEKNKNKNKLKS